MNLIEAIYKRRSVRTYSPYPLSDGDIASIRKAIVEAKSPFGGQVDISLHHYDNLTTLKLSTYGVIKGAQDFIIVSAELTRESALSIGYSLEYVVLKATQLGFGTCWIGGTFKEASFNANTRFPVQIVCPIGIAAKPRLLESLSRTAFGSNRRKPFEQLFCVDNPQFKESLEMVRLAPSAVNSQPWRAIAEGNRVHFYNAKNDVKSLIDIGIALRHFSIAEESFGHSVSFAIDDRHPDSKYSYVITGISDR